MAEDEHAEGGESSLNAEVDVPRGRHNIYRDGRVHVLAEMCSTCVFRRGNPMGLKAGRLREMVDAARGDESTIVCHKTLHRDDGVQHAGCRGFFDRFPTTPLQIAERLGLIDFDPAPQEHGVVSLSNDSTGVTE